MGTGWCGGMQGVTVTAMKILLTVILGLGVIAGPAPAMVHYPEGVADGDTLSEGTVKFIVRPGPGASEAFMKGLANVSKKMKPHNDVELVVVPESGSDTVANAREDAKAKGAAYRVCSLVYVKRSLGVDMDIKGTAVPYLAVVDGTGTLRFVTSGREEVQKSLVAWYKFARKYGLLARRKG